MNTVTERNFFKVEFFNTHFNQWTTCAYWDGGAYHDIEGKSIEELFTNLEDEYGPREYILEQIQKDLFRIYKVREIIDYTREEVNFPLTS